MDPMGTNCNFVMLLMEEIRHQLMRYSLSRKKYGAQNTSKVIQLEVSQLSNEKNPGWLGYIDIDLYRDCTTQLYRDYNKPLSGSILTNQFFSWLN